MSVDANIGRQSSIPVQIEDLGGFGQFPDRVYLIAVDGGKYAANNATTPDGEFVDGLACFTNPEDAVAYMGLPKSVRGSVVGVTFDESREIAKCKACLGALLLFAMGRIVEIHYIR